LQNANFATAKHNPVDGGGSLNYRQEGERNSAQSDRLDNFAKLKMFCEIERTVESFFHFVKVGVYAACLTLTKNVSRASICI
jgi:hypothetical protein